MRIALRTGLAVAASSVAIFLLPQAAVAATQTTASRSVVGKSLVPRIKAQMWNFTCGNPAPHQAQNATYRTGVADKCLWAEAQELAYAHGYRGPVDGIMGPNSWRGFQSWLNANGFGAGAADGIPGPQTYAAIQRLAKQRGDYAGPVDGIMGPNSWKGFGYALNRIHFAP